MAGHYPFSALTGGGTGALDKINGALLNDADTARGCVDDGAGGFKILFYRLDASSGAVESSPDVISPDVNAGTKRWILAKVEVDASTTAAAIAAAKAEAIANAAPVGAVQTFYRATAPTGWLKANGTTIGNASSGATQRANADTVALYTVLWEESTNTELPIQDSSGVATTRGASAQADFDANKRLPLPELRGEFVRGLDDGRGVDTGRALGSAQVDAFKTHNHGVYYSLNAGASGSTEETIAGSGNPTVGTTSVGDTETRPRNIALLACIKY